LVGGQAPEEVGLGPFLDLGRDGGCAGKSNADSVVPRPFFGWTTASNGLWKGIPSSS